MTRCLKRISMIVLSLALVASSAVSPRRANAAEPFPALEQLPVEDPATSAPTRVGSPTRNSAPATDASKYDPKTMAVLMNYCRESLCKIVDLSDRLVLDQEYQRLVNNIDVTKIQDDEIAAIIGRLMVELNDLKLSEVERGYIAQIYNKKVGDSVLDSLRGKDVFGKLSSPVTFACQSILTAVTAAANSVRATKMYHRDLDTKTLTIQEQDMKRLAALRSQFFDTEYKLYRRYNLPDRMNLKEVQLEQYIKVVGDEDPKRRLERLTRLKDDFEAYPPFWYQIGLAAQESGNAPLAFQYYRKFEEHAVPVLREDQDYVMLCMHRIMMYNHASERKAILRDLASIERNTKYYYKWENILFAALTYYDLDDVTNARRLIQTSINEGYNVTLHQDVLVTMESNVARGKLKGTQRDLVAATEGNTAGTSALSDRANRLEALRALGHQLTDIALTVSPRSRGGTNAKFAVPVYNVYLLGRSAIKGDIYLDDCVLQMPSEWFSKGKEKPTITLLFNKTKFRPSGKSSDKKNGFVEFTFSRVFNEDDVLEKGKEYEFDVLITNKASEMTLHFMAKRITDEVLAARPQLAKDEPYFDLFAIDYQGGSYKYNNGLILPAS